MGSGAAEDQTPEEVGASAAPATSATDNSNEKGGETIKDMPAAPAEGAKDQGGNLLEPDAIVVMTSKKHQKAKRNGFKGRIIFVHSHFVLLQVLDGPWVGQKRTAKHSSVYVVSPPPKQAKLLFAPTASAAGEAPAASAAGEATKPVAPAESVDPAIAPAAEDPEEQEKPYEECMGMFGDLDN